MGKATPHEHMLETIRLLEKKKKARKKTLREGKEYSIDNAYRVKKQLYHSRINKFDRY